MSRPRACWRRRWARRVNWLRHKDPPLNARERKALNWTARPDGFESGMTTRKGGSINSVSRVTAYCELADLVAKGCLVPLPSPGRSSG